MKHEQAKALVEAWIAGLPSNPFTTKMREDLISAIAAAPCGECVQLRERVSILETAVTLAEEETATGLAVELAEAEHKIAQLEAASRPSPDDEATAWQIVEACLMITSEDGVEPQVKAVTSILTASRNAVIGVVEAKRDEWQRLADEKKDAPYQPNSLLAQVAAANEILDALRKEPTSNDN